jgi:two-component system OmpR family sensor kinase
LRFTLELLKDSKSVEQVECRALMMEEDINDLEQLISEILTYSKIDHMELTIQFAKVTIGQLIQIAIDKIKPLQHHFVLNIDAETSNTFICANVNYASRALLNLLKNADYYAALIVKLSAIKVSEYQLQIIIEDDGCGITEDQREKVFKPFVQLAQHSIEKRSGYGLGLAITHKIIEQHQWHIHVEDSSLGGAKFIITIPYGLI